MRAAKTKKSKTHAASLKKAKSKKAALKTTKAKKRQSKRAPAILQDARPFRFTAADVVQILFAGAKKPEGFRVDDMVEATLTALDGQTRTYFQYRLLGTASERVLWFFDPKPVGTSDPIGPSLWYPINEQSLEGLEPVAACSGHFSTKSVTSYDGSGSRHAVKVDDNPTYRMQLDLNGQRAFCESLPIAIRKGKIAKEPMQEMYQQLERDDAIESVGSIAIPDEKPIDPVPRTEFPTRAGIVQQIETSPKKRTTKIRDRLTLISPVLLQANRLWRFRSAFGEHGYLIRDARFLSDLLSGRGKLPMKEGNQITAEVEIHEIFEGGVWVPKERFIDKVVTVHRQPKQSDLFAQPKKRKSSAKKKRKSK